MAAEKIGPATCPLCRGTAAVSLSKAQLCVLTCNCCNSQLFTRSDRSDSLVRELLKPRAEPEIEARRAPPVDTPPAPEPEPQPVPAPASPAPVTKRSPFGLMGL